MNWLQNLIVGTLFFGSLAILGYFTIVSESGPFAKPGQYTVVFFDNAEGIKVGSRVTVLGVPMGRVYAIDLVSVDHNLNPVEADSPYRTGQRVALTLELNRPVIFYDNYSVALKNESLLSGKIVSIDPGSVDPTDPSAADRIIPVAFYKPADLKVSGMTPLDYSIKQIDGAGTYTDLQGQSSGDPLAGISELISENREDVRRAVNNVAEITRKINTGHGTIGKLVNDDELHRDATYLLKDAEIVVREMRESLEDTREQAPVNSFIRAALTAF